MEEAENKPVEKKKKAKRPRIYEVTAKNDIKFRGRLSYRHLRILGWAFLIIAQIAVILNMNAALNGTRDMYGDLPLFLSAFSNMMSPLFLIAVFSIVVMTKDGYHRLIISYCGLALLVIFAFFVFYQHYFVGLLDAIHEGEGAGRAESFLLAFTGEGFLAFNIFVDLALCSLVMFFINYKPKKYFQGKKIIIFRLLVLLPIIYEITSIILKMLTSSQIIHLSPLFFPFLTTKAPMAFIIFLTIAWFFKRRERVFLKHGKTIEEYKEFENTNTNRFQFSIFLSVVIAITVVIDLVLLFVLSVILIESGAIPVDEAEAMAYYAERVTTVYNWGFGKTVPMIATIPLIIFFDYHKTYKNKLIDIIIPVLGVVLLIMIYLEGGFEVLRAFLSSPKE